MYNTALRALERLGLADAFGNTRVPLYVLNVTYPLIDARDHALLRRQARRADGRGGPAGVHRAGASTRSCAAPTSRPRSTARTCCRWPASTPAPWCATAFGKFLAPYRPDARRCRRRRRERGRQARLASAASESSRNVQRARRLLHRLPGAADLHRHEAGRARTRPASRELRHRLPPVLDPAAVQHRRDDHGLRPGRRRRGGASTPSPTSARSRSWATAASGTTASVARSATPCSTERQRTHHRRQRLHRRDGGQDILSSHADNTIRTTENTIEKAVRGVGVEMGAHDHAHLRRRQDARRACARR